MCQRPSWKDDKCARVTRVTREARDIPAIFLSGDGLINRLATWRTDTEESNVLGILILVLYAYVPFTLVYN